MAEAASRDSNRAAVRNRLRGHFLAWLTGAGDGAPAAREAHWSTLAVYLTFLATISDNTHILRKFDAATAETIRSDAADRRAARRGSPVNRSPTCSVELGRGLEIARD